MEGILAALAELVWHIWEMVRNSRIRRGLRRRGWPPETVYRLDSFGSLLVHWRRVPPYEEVAVVPWHQLPSGLMADSPFTWKDPESTLWAVLRLLDMQRGA